MYGPTVGSKERSLFVDEKHNVSLPLYVMQRHRKRWCLSLWQTEYLLPKSVFLNCPQKTE